MSVLPEHVVQAVREVALGSPVIVIDGPAGSGKTTTAEQIAALLAPRSVAVVHMDDLYDDWTGLDDSLTDYLTEELEPQIRAGDEITHRRFDWHARRFGDPVTLPPTDVLIIEGVGAGQPALADVADLAVWVEADPDICARRWLDRDGPQMEHRLPEWVRREQEHFVRYRTRERADVSFRTDVTSD